MLLKKIILHNFRNFTGNTFTFNPRLTFIFGKNARGKTNLLEAINFLLKGAGFRDTKEEELIKLGELESTVEGELIGDNDSVSVRIDFAKKKLDLVKNFYLGKTRKIRNFYLKEVIPVVLFSPEQIEIIIGPPSLRRDYFDHLLSITDPVYKSRLNNYHQALRKRNKILETIYDEAELREQLLFWNKYLIENGQYITKKRDEYAQFLNSHKRIDSKIFSIKYQKNEINLERIEEYFSEEKRLRRTIVGPQKDDFQIYLGEMNVNLYGARSEERLAIFWLKLNELNFYEKIYGKKPILLLDDIFSELDKDNQRLILLIIKDYQTVTTSTNRSLLDLIDFSDDGSYHTIDL
ncbi:MAG: replication and repair protein RecF protein [Candidatus Roizmanbacteria bacterium GW2011_GWC2_37_13]|uniref:DNA replication and repair protein RecF n=1 Tax=Candidatus Roizmanbacteria bacterium GW2011_GWC2_37_13 TaxID=1618486 RepID=A0A0G0G347_9BACT|nr:MAG: replication and repair protein RecF protein [Candidatus Roizmanbacteria bacterium GW2011_GWC1_37_12]KKQ24457.1 MAG: replication and repair protein RecF protein [Candidatus Roizmanbacteria bacterium GW2011_GWC2_37_13]